MATKKTTKKLEQSLKDKIKEIKKTYTKPTKEETVTNTVVTDDLIKETDIKKILDLHFEGKNIKEIRKEVTFKINGKGKFALTKEKVQEIINEFYLEDIKKGK